MSSIIDWIALIIVIIMLSSAIAVLILPNMVAAVIASSIVSLCLTIIFALLKAPDVAMTEAAIGAGLSGLILAIALKRLGFISLGDKESNNLSTNNLSNYDENVHALNNKENSFNE